MKIRIGNIYSTASGDKLEMTWLDELLTVEETIFSFYTKRPKLHQFRFLQDQQFRSGLLRYILQKANGDVAFDLIDCRQGFDLPLPISGIPLTLPDSEKKTITLREDQLISARALIELQRGIIELPPGAGKTEIAIAAMMGVNPEERFAIFVHTETLHSQWISRLIERGMPPEHIGYIASHRWNPNRITVCMTPTLASRIDDPRTISFLESITGFVADECHISANDSNEKVLVGTPYARFRWGLSATPLEYDLIRNLTLIGLIGDPLHTIGIQELIDQGEIADIQYHFIFCPFQSLYSPITPMNDWRQLYDYYLHFNPILRNLISRITELDSDPCLVIVNRIEHGKYLQQAIPSSRFIHGQSLDREIVLHQFKKNRIKVLISSPILDFGIDIPDLRKVVLAGGMESPVRLIQRIGRGLRKKSKDNMLHVYDFNFEGIPYLGDHSLSRINTMKDRCPNLKITSTL